jgi:hypothetical protein
VPANDVDGARFGLVERLLKEGAKIGTQRSPFPSWCSVFGDFTRNRECSQSMSPHFSFSTSDGQRNPP